VLEQAILAAKPLPEISNYDQLSLAIWSAIRQALATGQEAAATIAAPSGELKSIPRIGDDPCRHRRVLKVEEEIQHDRSETAGPGNGGLAGSGPHAGARCVWQLIVEYA